MKKQKNIKKFQINLTWKMFKLLKNEFKCLKNWGLSHLRDFEQKIKRKILKKNKSISIRLKL